LKALRTASIADIAELREFITLVAKIGFWLAVGLFTVEVGKGAVAIPAIFEALSHVH
jgi:hypothetical protein